MVCSGASISLRKWGDACVHCPRLLPHFLVSLKEVDRELANSIKPVFGERGLCAAARPCSYPQHGNAALHTCLSSALRCKFLRNSLNSLPSLPQLFSNPRNISKQGIHPRHLLQELPIPFLNPPTHCGWIPVPRAAHFINTEPGFGVFPVEGRWSKKLLDRF